VIVLIAAAITIAVRMTGKAIFSPFVLLYRVLAAVAGLVYRVVRGIILTIRATPGALYRVPIRAYRRLVMFRNWLLAKVEYLQSESQKWSTVFSIARSPYSLLRGMGFTPQMAASLLIGASAVTSGVVVNETLLSSPSFANADAGIYAAPDDAPWYVFSEGTPEHNTLLVQLGSTKVGRIVLEDTSVGTVYGGVLPSGATNSLDIGGDGTLNTWLLVGHLLVDRLRCESLLLTNIQAHTLTINGVVSDGMSISSVPGTARKRSVIGGAHQANEMLQESGTFDRIEITANTSGVNGEVDELILRNILTRDACKISRVKVGHLEIINSEIGGDSNLATKEFTVTDSVSASVIKIASNVEVLMAVPATQTLDS
jgi:hypothetical protein